MIPNFLQLARKSDGTLEFGLAHKANARGNAKVGFLTFALNPVLETDELQAIIDEIKATKSQARFGIPTPSASTFYLIGPEMGRKELTAQVPGSNPLRTPCGFTVDLSSIMVRVALNPASYKHPIFTIGHEFNFRGIERDEQGVAHAISRKFANSFVVYGLCALYPELVLDLDSGQYGCAKQNYDHGLVRQIQQQLKTRGYDVGPIDGVVGPRTDRAIRQFQKERSLLVDGIPTVDVLKQLRSS